MSDVPRITPKEARPRVQSGAALLVCAYEDDAKFRKLHLEGAIPYSIFAAQLGSISKARELIIYCAWPAEASAAGLADKMIAQGYSHSKALLGGVTAWQQAGFPLEPEG